MTQPILQGVIDNLKLSDFVGEIRESSIAATLEIEQRQLPDSEIKKIPRIGFLYEAKGLTAYQKYIATGSIENHLEAKKSFDAAFQCWKTLSIHGTQNTKGFPQAISERIAQSLSKEIDPYPISIELALALRVAVSGLLSERSAETRLHLYNFSITLSSSGNWLERVASNICSAFVLLTRKDGGWEDIENAIKAIDALRSAQSEFEDGFIEKQTSEAQQTRSAIALVGFYHLAQIITIVGDYLRGGPDGKDAVIGNIDQHHRKAINAFQVAGYTSNFHIGNLLRVGCHLLIRNSLWSHIDGLPDDVRRFAENISNKENTKPVIELWPSQQEVLKRSFLDSYKRVVIVEMPTSAGKTLLAKFAIAQTKSFNSQGVIAYIVPTRALVNQVVLELRQDFGPLGYRVELAIPAFELDPTEKILLSERIDILVTTPEKLDLLIRSDHPVIQELALVVADEAHNLQDTNRGARLELLLATIKRERRNTRFLLLSPFIPNGKELVTWLGDDRGLDPIQVSWTPSEKVVCAVSVVGKASKRKLILETLPSAHSLSLKPGVNIVIGNREATANSNSIEGLSKAAVDAMIAKGGVLILCRGKGTATTRARQIALGRPEIKDKSELLQAVCNYIRAETGYDSGLVECLKHGVAYHHAGVSQEVRLLIEQLIRRHEIEVICGTTTLAQGVNFPISTVIVETLNKGDEKLTYTDFWNIAGRAGRALVDSVGVVAFPTPNKKKKDEVIDFLRSGAQEISSQLASILIQIEQIGTDFNLKTLRNWPQLSVLLQFLAHAVRVSDKSDIADEMENILRSSLVYHQAIKKSEEAVNKFINLCRIYVKQIARYKGSLALADKTGFATPTVFYMQACAKNIAGIDSPDTWSPDVLFGEDTSTLKQRIQLISGLPELHLGDGSGGPLDIDRTTNILRDWVKGDSLVELTRKYSRESAPIDNGEKLDKAVSTFSAYLFSTLITNASWGLGALEGVCLAGEEEQDHARHIPSMVFFGVNSMEAVWLRMAGLPRVAAEGVSDIWRERAIGQPKSYQAIRDWVSSLKDADWQKALHNKNVDAKTMSVIWKELSGSH